MAGTTKTARLNLEIVAKDQAKQVFDAFARNLKANMEQVEAAMKNALNMDRMVADVRSGVSQIDAAIHGMDIREIGTRMEAAEHQVRESVRSMDAALHTVRGSTESAQAGFRELASSADRMRASMLSDFNQVEAGARQMGDHLNAASRMAHFGDLMDVGHQIAGVGRSMTGFFVDAIKNSAEFDQNIHNTKAAINAGLIQEVGGSAEALKKLKSQMDLTMDHGRITLAGSEIEKMKNKAIQLGSAGFFSATEVAHAMDVLAKQGISYQDIMGGALETVHNVAAANQEDMSQTADVVADIIHSMGGALKTEFGDNTKAQMTGIGDAISGVFVASRVNMNDFLTTMKYIAPQASATGMRVGELAGAIATLGNHGIRGSTAGTGLRRMLTNLTPATEKAAGMMEKLGLITKDGSNVFYDTHGKLIPLVDIQKKLHDAISGLNPEMQQMAIKTIFGQYALSSMMAIAGEAPDKFAAMQRMVTATGITVDMMKDKQAGLGFAINAVTKTFDTLKKAVGEDLHVPVVKLLALVHGLMQGFLKMDPTVRRTITTFAAITGVVLLVGGSILAFLGTIGLFAASLPGAISALGAIGGAIGALVGPVTIVIAIIAAFTMAWKKNLGDIRGQVNGFTTWFKSSFGKTFDSVKKDVMSGIKTITKEFDKLSPSIKKSVDAVIKFLGPQFISGMKTVITAVSDGVKEVAKWFNKMSPDFAKAMGALIKFFQENSETWKTLWNVFKFIVKFAWDWITDIVKHAWGVFSGIIQFFTHIINGEWKKAFEDLWQIVKNAFLLALDLMGGFVGKGAKWFAKFLEHTGLFNSGFGKIIVKMFENFGKVANQAWNFVSKIFSNGIRIVESLLKGWSSIVSNVLNAVLKIFQGKPGEAMAALERAFRSGINMAGSVLRGLWNIVDSILGGLPSKFLNWAKDSIYRFADGISGGLSSVWNVIHGLWNNLVSYFGSMPRNFLTWGKNAIGMFADGIMSGISKVTNAVSSVANKVKDFLGFHSPTKDGPASESDVWMPNMMNMFSDGIHQNRDKIKDAVASVGLDLQHSFKNTGDVVRDNVAGISAASHPSSGAMTTHTNNRRNSNVQVIINVDGRSAKTDQELSENIANAVRTQVRMVM